MTTEYKMGDTVLYKGEKWDVGFINRIAWAGTLRLQKGSEAGAESINHIYPNDVVLIDAEGK